MNLRCRECNNTKRFISEAFFLHWTTLDGSGGITSIDNRQGDEEARIDDDYPHLECADCNSTNVDTDADPIGELPRDHPARLDTGGTGHPEDYAVCSTCHHVAPEHFICDGVLGQKCPNYPLEDS